MIRNKIRLASLLGALLLAAGVQAATWQEGTTYSTNAVVDYNGKTYSALVTHTAYVGAGWNPAATPTLWKEIGNSASPAPSTGPTASPSANPTTSPTAVPTNSPVPSNSPATTPPPSTGVAAWDASKVYNGGARVSVGTAIYEAKWWTQGNVPGSDQWGPWKLISGTPTASPTTTASPTPTATPSTTPSATPTVTPTTTPTATPTATPSTTPTASPTPSTTPSTDLLPKHVVVGYWHNFDNGSGVMRLKDVPAEYNIINVSFVEGDQSAAKGTAAFVLDKLFNEAEFIADIKLKQSQGVKVLVSLGGANGVIVIDSLEARERFIKTLGDIIAKYGFDGLDLDMENNLTITAQDDYRKPVTPQIVNVIAGVKAIKARFGDKFILTMAPEVNYVQGGHGFYGGTWGGYLPIIHGLRDDLNMLHVQHYNTGSIGGTDGRQYSQGTMDFQVAMTDMLLTGFNLGGDVNKPFPALRADQVGFGLPATTSAAGGGYLSIAETQKALDCLMKLQNCGTYKPQKAQPDLRGIMTWSINWDSKQAYQFAKSHSAYFKK
ncbi:chitinase [uncultured Deefgea sp.]|uniref:chitinase n=1 Tax=uncultured Deefgea sp. TaxID=1304914 RepID=UPI00262095A2|nr:glycosyl hydrolase family 18 protein [uncultured Deefgea sp.]